MITATLCALVLAACTPIPEKKADGRVDEPLPVTTTTAPSLPPRPRDIPLNAWTRARCSPRTSGSS